MLSIAVALVTGIVLIAGMATAATPAPTTPYPTVPINTNVCKAEAIKVAQAQLAYDQAVADYNRTLQLFNRNAASAQDLRNAQGKVDTTAIALNTAKYAQATCQNNAANPANKDCVNLSLELNRLIDELAITQDQEAIAKANYDAAAILFNRNAISAQEYQQIKTAYDTAKLQTQLIQQLISDQRAKTTAANCKNVDRPAPTPTPTTPAPTSTTPAPTSTPTTTPPTSSSSPTPITSSPVPVSTAGF
jgi:multidrug resistance efflux pump